MGGVSITTGQGLERQRKKQKEDAEEKRPFGVGMSYVYVTGDFACGVETGGNVMGKGVVTSRSVGF